ncbi:MAG TPA: helix-hairpin-helix domain-containing protein [Candidatus Avacidaminococcus intestinavium]|uniref:Helix-hairpin-helix domain-containing protein n=1 Tax=Candidatus Avacidaminococcus intestinavium TaxID=2840684 RepID=A0A9D1MPL6_9FIRM|nr:helix-hairpin-helix domain-containing protein [Candidatus Avacidaminococcus intestinavium]
MEVSNKKKIIVVILVVVVLTILSILFSLPNKVEDGKEPPLMSLSQEQASSPKITVYISGAVQNPGIYEIMPNQRVGEVLKVAGGVAPNADLNKVNLAKKCKDGMQINVPQAKGKKQMQATNLASNSSKETNAQQIGTQNAINEQKINLNTATSEELQSLPGVGAATAERIIEYRSAHQFKKVEEIMQVKGIGKAKFAKLQAYLEV